MHRFEVTYWREGNDEVDFVLRKNRKIVAIEVKSNGEASTTGLAKFRQLFNPTAHSLWEKAEYGQRNFCKWT